jgi:membrane fusion protein (multidrug efflux system)
MANVQELPAEPVSARPSPAGAREKSATPAAKGSSRKTVIGIAVAAVVAAVGGSYYVHSLSFEDTDDAQVDGDISAVSPKVSGQLKSVRVVENQHVNAGDLLAEIESSDFEVAVAQAKASVAQAKAQLRAEEPSVAITETSNGTLLATSSSDVGSSQADLAGSEATVKQGDAQLAEARANEKLANTELERSKKLVATGAVSAAELDQREATADAARAATSAAEQALRAANERINQARSHLAASASRAVEAQKNGPRQVATREANVSIRRANVDLAEAQLRQAELNLSYTKIYAPVSGVVGKKSLNVGDRVQPGQELLAITQTDRLWVTANFRETQLRHIHPGESVSVHIDALDADFHGSVESIGGATGSRYSLLPPENATGNYVKVVQRVPVRVSIDPGQAGLDALRPGLSAEPKVKVK